MILLVYDGHIIHYFAYDRKNVFYYLKILRCKLKHQEYDTFTFEEFYKRGGNY